MPLPARLARVLIAASIAVFAATGSAFAAPANDDAANATALSADASPVSDSSADAGIELTEPLTASDSTFGCDASSHDRQDGGVQGGHTLWYRVTGTGHQMTI